MAVWSLATACACGSLLGVVNVLAPDRLGTLMIIGAAAMGPGDAFSSGAFWGLGHFVGMALVCGVFTLLRHFVWAEVLAWSHYGDYCVGASMILCGLHFLYRESTFLAERGGPSPCECHLLKVEDGKRKPAPPQECRSYRLQCQSSPPDLESLEAALKSGGTTTPLTWGTFRQEAPPQASQKRGAWTGRDVKGAAIGVFQGMCCPTGLMCVPFVVNARTPPVLSCFLATCGVVSILGVALFTMGWASLVNRGFGAHVSLRGAYRASCCITLALGAVWIGANYVGALGKLDIAGELAANRAEQWTV